MQHIETSNGSMDWHKYPKSRTSIRTGQPETLDSTKCHTFPGFRGKTLDILWHDSTLQFFFVPNVLIEMPAYTNSFIVIPARLLPASLTCIRPSQLDAWPKADSGQHHSGWLRQAGCRASGPGPPIRVSSAGPVSLSRQGVSCTATQCHLST